MRVYRQIAVFIIVFASLLIVGCGQPVAQISFSGDMNVSNDELRMNGRVIDSSGPTQTFENVSIYLYSSKGELIKQKNLGTYSGNSKQFSLYSKEVPEYIIIDSPTFWELDDTGVSYYERSAAEGGYASHGVSSRDELPVELPT